jgi:hypothetical protein
MNEAPLGDSDSEITRGLEGGSITPELARDVEKTADDDLKEQFVTWDGEDDPESPYNLAPWRKWLIVAVVSTASLCVCVYINIDG